MRYFLCALGAVLIVWILSGVTQVQPGERAVIRRFGQVLDNKPGPGLYVGLPWGVERVDRVKIEEERRIRVGFDGRSPSDTSGILPGQMLTGDHNLINLQVEISYRVVEDEVVDYVVQQERVELLLARAGEAVLSEWVAGRPVDDIWGRKELPGKPFTQEVQNRIAPYRLGIQVLNASVTHLAPPDDVRTEFEKVSLTHAGIETAKNEATQIGNRKKTDAEIAANSITSSAKAYQFQQRREAEAEAENFTERLKQYRELAKANPHYLNALWWDEMSKLYEQMRRNGRIDLLDNRLSADGLDITQFPPLPHKK